MIIFEYVPKYFIVNLIRNLFTQMEISCRFVIAENKDEQNLEQQKKSLIRFITKAFIKLNDLCNNISFSKNLINFVL